MLLLLFASFLILRERADDGGAIVRTLGASLHAEADAVLAQFEAGGCRGITKASSAISAETAIETSDGKSPCSAAPDLTTVRASPLVAGVSGFRLTSRYVWRVRTNASQGSYVVFFVLPVTTHSDGLLSDLREFGFPQLPVLLTVSAVSTFVLVFLFTRPLALLQEGARAIASGNLKIRLRRRRAKGFLGEDAFQAVIHDFNQMAERLESLVGAHKLLLRDVSHELRSPLTRLNVALGLARKHSNSETRRHLDRIEIEGDRLNEMIAQLLSLSAMEVTAAGSFEKFSLGDLIRGMASDAEYESGEKQCTVDVVTDSAWLMVGNRELLHRAVWNVLRNAVQFSPPRGVITVTISHLDGQAAESAIQIIDQGSGISEEDVNAIFRPFYRSDRTRSSGHGGFGVGLSIAERAVHLHRGHIRAANAEQGGAKITIVLPTGL